MVSVCRCRCRRAVVNGSLDLAARAIAQHAFLFHLAIQGAATEFCCVGQMHRTRDARVIRRSVVTEHCNCFVKRVRIYLFLRAASIKAIVGALLSLARC